MTDDPQIKMIDPCALASVACGVVLCEAGFSPVAEAAEWIMGHPVFTHEFVHPKMQAAMIAGVRAQYPDLAIDEPADWRAAIVTIRATHGDAVPVRRGSHERPGGPMSTLRGVMEGK